MVKLVFVVMNRKLSFILAVLKCLPVYFFGYSLVLVIVLECLKLVSFDSMHFADEHLSPLRISDSFLGSFVLFLQLHYPSFD